MTVISTPKKSRIYDDLSGVASQGFHRSAPGFEWPALSKEPFSYEEFGTVITAPDLNSEALQEFLKGEALALRVTNFYDRGLAKRLGRLILNHPDRVEYGQNVADTTKPGGVDYKEEVGKVASDKDFRKEGRRSFLLKPRVGELIIINTRRPHAVAAYEQGIRVSVACFIGYVQENPLKLYS